MLTVSAPEKISVKLHFRFEFEKNSFNLKLLCDGFILLMPAQIQWI